MYKEWLDHRLKKVKTMTEYTIIKNEIERIDSFKLLKLVKAKLRAKIGSVGT